jgi:16S rRNA (adenine1518-N6/adenine1519-N6)-dimethyltransferase
MNKKLSPKNILIEQGLRPKKSFGQNFMVDQRINGILTAAVASLGKDLPIIEIGAGTGSLTDHLLGIAPVVHAVERDRELIPILKIHFAEQIKNRHLVLHEADGARFDLKSVINDQGILVGNLPYHLTSSIILLALKNRHLLRGAVFLVQKEVAERLVSRPNHKSYGFLTVILDLAFQIEVVSLVDKNAFWPVPKVDSAIIKMRVHDQGISRVRDLDAFIFFVRAIFQKRRKKLSTILAGELSKDDLLTLGICPDLRPENLQPGQFLQMFESHSEKHI